MYTLKKSFKVETGHVLDTSYMGECQRFHGHSAKIVVSVCALGLNEDGMVMDFKLLKELFKPLYDKLDHRFLISERKAKRLLYPCEGDIGALCADFGIEVVSFNPTAENIAKWLYDSFNQSIRDYQNTNPGKFSGYLNYIEYWETENACVRYDPNY